MLVGSSEEAGMSLRFDLCACQLHGRLIGDPGTVPSEIASREMAKALFDTAERLGTFEGGELSKARKAVAGSMMPIKDEWIEETLRVRITLWNIAAATTNDSDAFAKTDFHAYHAMVDDFGSD
jgi:hypothetical protein